MEPYKPKDPGKRIYALSMPMPMWHRVQLAAKIDKMSAAEWMRQAITEKLEKS